VGRGDGKGRRERDLPRWIDHKRGDLNRTDHSGDNNAGFSEERWGIMVATLTLGDLIRTITDYDAGGGIILLVMFGVPFGILVDYLWNWLVLSLTLRWMFRGSSGPVKKTSRKATALYSLYITVLGLLIDWVYYELIWYGGVWIPEMALPGQLAWMLLPVAVLWLGNFFLSKLYLKLDTRQASVTGSFMALFTAPWLVLAVPYIANWG
jgi:hypothetical protein